MRTLIFMFMFTISFSVLPVITNTIGLIGKDTQLSIYYDSDSKQGVVELNFFKDLNTCPCSQKFSIKEVQIDGDNNSTFIFDKGTLFIPQLPSSKQARFNDEPINIFEVEDISD